MASGSSTPPLALQNWPEDEVMRRLARSSPDVWDSMLEETGVINGPHLSRNLKSSSSVGDLDKLSNELLVLVLQHLDLQSLCRFMRASYRAEEVANSMLIYQNLLKHASPVLIVLGKTNLASHHTILDLHTTMSSENCVSCHQFGAFLFLPTCERACLNCLHRNMRFWVLSVKEAQDIYGISQKEIRQLPSMMSVPFGRRRGRRKKLVSVRLAQELGLVVHGSRQDMTTRVLHSGKMGDNMNQYSWWAEPGETLLDWNNNDHPIPGPRSAYWGSASIRFPHLRCDQTVDFGYWCVGCRFRRKQISEVSIYSHGMDYIGKSPAEEKELEIHHREEIREWSSSGLQKHVLTCIGAQELESVPVV